MDLESVLESFVFSILIKRVEELASTLLKFGKNVIISSKVIFKHMEGQRGISPFREVRNVAKRDPMRSPQRPSLSMRRVKIDKQLVVQLEDPSEECPQADLYLNAFLRSEEHDQKDLGAVVENLFQEARKEIEVVTQTGEVLAGIKIKFSSRDVTGVAIALALHRRLIDALLEGDEA